MYTYLNCIVMSNARFFLCALLTMNRDKYSRKQNKTTTTTNRENIEQKKLERKRQNEIDVCYDDNIDDTLTKYDCKTNVAQNEKHLPAGAEYKLKKKQR